MLLLFIPSPRLSTKITIYTTQKIQTLSISGPVQNISLENQPKPPNLNSPMTNNCIPSDAQFSDTPQPDTLHHSTPSSDTLPPAPTNS